MPSRFVRGSVLALHLMMDAVPVSLGPVAAAPDSGLKIPIQACRYA
jgi:hypothetical protein